MKNHRIKGIYVTPNNSINKAARFVLDWKYETETRELGSVFLKISNCDKVICYFMAAGSVFPFSKNN